MARYTYSDLRNPRSIRLVRILGSHGPGIKIEILTTDLADDNNKPEYTALSYTWGDPEDKIDIFVGSDRKALGITRNLAGALQAISHQDTNRVFWIDAICINQGDLTERSHQVGLMTDIYNDASLVLVWLGPGSNECSRTMEKIQSFAREIDIDWSKFKISSKTSLTWQKIASQLLAQPSFVDELSGLLSLSWFERLWIWQEIRIGGKQAIIQCGDASMPWTDFHNAIFTLRRSSHPSLSREMMRRMAVVVQMKDMSSSNAMVALTAWTRKAQCGDQRDRVFAVKGMIGEAEAAAIEVDYSKTVEAVYLDVAIQFITKLKSLDLLTCCRFEIKRETLPSWVPNWSKENGRKFAQILNPDATGRSACEATVLDDGSLMLNGKHCCSIQNVTRLWNINSPETAVVEMILSILNGFDLTLPYVGGGDMLEALAITFELGSIAENFEPIPESQLLRISQARAALNQILVDRDARLSASRPESSGYISSLSYRLEGWTFFVTDMQYIGLSPAAVHAGDTVSLFLGSRSLISLRQVRPNTYEILGECYVRGLMHAEGLLGPIRKGWRRVARHDVKSGQYRACWRFEGESHHISFQTADPRLGLLPAGWRLKRHGLDDVLDLYENSSDGRGSFEDLEADPRLTSAALLGSDIDILSIVVV